MKIFHHTLLPIPEERIKLNSLLHEFKVQVYDNAEEIDPFDDEDWESLAKGWALGKGLEASKCEEFFVLLLEKGWV